MEPKRYAFIEGTTQKVEIEDAIPGARYSCVDCGKPLMVKNQGTEREHHFAHFGRHCDPTVESAFHRNCIFLVSKGTTIRLGSGEEFHYTKAVVEERVRGRYINNMPYKERYIDVTVYNEQTGRKRAIEIKYRNALTLEKIEYLQMEGYDITEIDLSDCNPDMDLSALTERLFYGKGDREDYLAYQISERTQTGFTTPGTPEWLQNLGILIGLLLAGVFIYTILNRSGSKK